MAFRQPERSRAKTRITIRIDGEVLDWFRNQVQEAGGGSYQTLMNRALRDHVARREGTLAETLRRVVREELARKKRRKRPRKAAPKRRARARQRRRDRRKPARKRHK